MVDRYVSEPDKRFGYFEAEAEIADGGDASRTRSSPTQRAVRFTFAGGPGDLPDLQSKRSEGVGDTRRSSMSSLVVADRGEAGSSGDWANIPGSRMSPSRIRRDAEAEMSSSGGVERNPRLERRQSIRRIIAPVLARAADNDSNTSTPRDSPCASPKRTRALKATNFAKAVPLSATDDERAELALTMLLQASFERQAGETVIMSGNEEEDHRRLSRLADRRSSLKPSPDSTPTSPLRHRSSSVYPSALNVRSSPRRVLDIPVHKDQDEDVTSPKDSPTCVGSPSPSNMRTSRSRSDAFLQASSTIAARKTDPGNLVNNRSTLELGANRARSNSNSPASPGHGTVADFYDTDDDSSPFEPPAIAAPVSPTRPHALRSQSFALQRSSSGSITEQCSPGNLINRRSTTDLATLKEACKLQNATPQAHRVLAEAPSPKDRLQQIRNRTQSVRGTPRSPLSQSSSQEPALPASRSPLVAAPQAPTFRVSTKPTKFVKLRQLKIFKKKFDELHNKKTGTVKPVIVSDSTVDSSSSDMLVFEFDGQMFLTKTKNEEKLTQGVDFPTLLRCMYPDCERAVYESMLAQVLQKSKLDIKLSMGEVVEFEQMWTRFNKDAEGNMDRYLFQEALRYLNIVDKCDMDVLFEQLCDCSEEDSIQDRYITKVNFADWWFSRNHTNTELAAQDAANVFKALRKGNK
mmetsp:Transcript_47709/g.91152  ORF Transcript_47709/g.91152 Transcript_47709/m.91152 type:complete len:690 (-) Transcript_47709:325-2394(-)